MSRRNNNGNGGNGPGKQHRRAQRENGNDVGNLDLLLWLVATRDDGYNVVLAIEQLRY